MNAKQAKKARWYARVQEAMMPAPTVDKDGVSSLLLVYRYQKLHVRSDGRRTQWENITIQYNPRTSGKGFYKALKKRNAIVRGSLPYVRYMCQQRIIELLTARRHGPDAAARVRQAQLAGQHVA